jgi:hypothetical protein
MPRLRHGARLETVRARPGARPTGFTNWGNDAGPLPVMLQAVEGKPGALPEASHSFLVSRGHSDPVPASVCAMTLAGCFCTDLVSLPGGQTGKVQRARSGYAVCPARPGHRGGGGFAPPGARRYSAHR